MTAPPSRPTSGGWRGRLVGAAALLIGLVLAVGLAEGLLRLLPLSLLVRGLRYAPEEHARYWRYRFAETYAGDRLDARLYDPDLGWDYERDGDRARGSRGYAVAKPAGVLRIVALGDSFTYGNEVADDAAPFPAVVERTLRHAEVLNFAVGGYGIDQAVLKFERVGRGYQPDVIVLGLFEAMYERTSLSFFSGAKPVFRRDGGDLRLLHTPVPSPETALADIRDEMRRTVRVVALARTLGHLADRALGDAVVRYRTEVDAVVTLLLARLRRDAESLGARVLVVSIPPGELFGTGRGAAARVDHRRLVELSAAAGLPRLDLADAFAGEREVTYRDRYIHRDDGTIGHLTPAGHRAAAALIVRRLCDDQRYALHCP